MKLKKNTVLDHSNRHITTNKFNKLTARNVVARLKLANLAFNGDVYDFVEKANFDDKLKNLNKKVTSNKTKHLKTEKKLIDVTNKIAQISKKGYDFC